MTKARRLGVSTPVLYAVDPLLHALTFEYVEGPSVKDIFLEFGLNGVVEERLDDIAMQIGDSIGKLHDGGLIHGDLTTSNMLLRMGTNQLVSYFICYSRGEEILVFSVCLLDCYHISASQPELSSLRSLLISALASHQPSLRTKLLIYMYWNEPYFQCILHVEMW